MASLAAPAHRFAALAALAAPLLACSTGVAGAVDLLAGPGPDGGAPRDASAPVDSAPVSDANSPGDAGPDRWRPRPGLSWDWQLATPVRAPAVEVIDIDTFDNAAQVVADLHASGLKVICYVDVGSYEAGRPDAASFPAAVLGAAYVGYPDERWLDIRQIDLLAPIMAARFDLARGKGCDGIEPDNMDGFDTDSHESSGFPLTADDQLRYNRWVSGQVRARGMAVGLKNDLSQAAALIDAFDFVLAESAFEFADADLLTPFVLQGKLALDAEYNLMTGDFCADARRLGVSAIRKDVRLGTYRQACP